MEHSPEDRQYYHAELDRALDEGNPKRAVLVKWDGFSKGNDGEPQVTPLHGTRFEVEFNREPSWQPVTRVESLDFTKRRKATVRGLGRAAILPDLQYPHESPEAISVALQIVRDEKPDKVVLLGDVLDLSAFSKYDQRPEYAALTQEAIIKAHRMLALLRSIAPMAEIVMLEGNHDIRLPKSILRNNMAAYGIKRADQLDNYPVMSVPYLLALDQLNIHYIEGYPANRYWINERLQCVHGTVAKRYNGTSLTTAYNERVSTILAHDHRIGCAYHTVNVHGGGRTNAAFSMGCLCRIDGAVPSVKGGVEYHGSPVRNFENWQNGMGMVSYEPGDGNFNLEQIYMNTMAGYRTEYRGRLYHPQEYK